MTPRFTKTVAVRLTLAEYRALERVRLRTKGERLSETVRRAITLLLEHSQ